MQTYTLIKFVVTKPSSQCQKPRAEAAINKYVWMLRHPTEDSLNCVAYKEISVQQGEVVRNKQGQK
jgi:hypothetical protein